MWLGIPAVIFMFIVTQMPWAYLQVNIIKSLDYSPGLQWVALRPSLGFSPILSAFGPEPYGAFGYIEFIWEVSIIGGLMFALGLGIWRRSRFALVVYGIWAALETVTSGALIVALFAVPQQDYCWAVDSCDSRFSTIAVVGRQPAFGLWLGLVCLALLWIPVVARLAALRVEAERQRASLAEMARWFAQPQQLSSLLYLVGIAVWFFGFILTPYAVQGCKGFPINWAHFTSPTCSGYDSNDALGAAMRVKQLPGGEYGLLFLITGLLLLIALVAIWQRGWAGPIIAFLLAITTAWLMALALNGLPYLLAHPPTNALSSGPWVAGAGPAITIAGNIILWLGAVALLGVRLARHERQTSRLPAGEDNAAP